MQTSSHRKNTQQKNITLKDADNWSNPILLITDAESSPLFKNGVVAYQEGDYQDTHIRLNIAAMDGDKVAVKARDFVAKELTTCQLGPAQKMARKWFAENSLRLLGVPTH